MHFVHQEAKGFNYQLFEYIVRSLFLEAHEYLFIRIHKNKTTQC